MTSKIVVNSIDADAGVSTVSFGSKVSSSEFIGPLTGTATTATNALGITTTQITIGDSFLKAGSVGLGTTDTTGRNAGVGTAIGTLIYNATTNEVQGYGPEGWVNIKTLEKLAATGGTTSTTARSGYTVHTFTGDGTFSVTSGSGNVEYLVIGGGGSGSSGCGGNPCAGGGGGAAALMFSDSFPVTPGSYTVTVGPGGTRPSDGTDSVFGTITSDAGGRAGGSSSGGDGGGGNPGGCGGASSSSQASNPGGTATGDPGGTNNSNSPGNGWGNDGGAASSNNNGGGGGGVGAAGGNSAAWPGNGGAGLSYSIDGTSVTYGVGGGGGQAGTSTPGPNGTANRGNGGEGGGGQPGGGGSGGNGGSGIVIIAYAN